MKIYKVLAIHEEGYEIQKKFATREEAEAFAKKAENKGCYCVHIAEIDE